MSQRTVQFAGRSLALVGDTVKVGDQALNFTVLDNGLQPRSLGDYEGKVKILSVVPSIDTPVCDLQTRRFNDEAQSLGDAVVVLTISMDLPFAQARWCGNAEIDRVVTLSDHRNADFGKSYGTLIPDLRLETRAVFVLDGSNKVVFAEYVGDLGTHPNYSAVIDAAKSVMESR